MRKLFITAFVSLSLIASAESFNVTLPVGPDDEGAMVQLVNFDNGDTIASVLAGPENVIFTGDISEPLIARAFLEGRRLGTFILEPGTINYSRENGASGTILNDRCREFVGGVTSLQHQFQQAQTEQEQEAIYNRYNAFMDSVISANSDNVLGYYIFLNGDISTMTAEELRAALAEYPQFAKYQRVQRYITMAECRAETQPGGVFKDFEITYNGKTEKLSDYVGKGKYTLVDFWASWCGPCLRQLPVLKDLYNRWHEHGLEVLGVAVWDNPADTEQAIISHELPWHCIIDAQSIPTDLYGITGIPCIILFDPEGKIVSRDKQGDELKADVDAAMQQVR